MLKAAQAIRAKAPNLTGYASGVALCIWLALSLLSPVAVQGAGFDLPCGADLVDSVHPPVSSDTSEGAEDDTVFAKPSLGLELVPAAQPLLFATVASYGPIIPAFAARAPPV
ncbi:hypothetical protein [Gilvimarinus sp. 1_MG-2023]|uniref:hypothetical protein n=1 Tax=Gilvimarinus sp. 1_MG-2023 TaxID=3062638 RepID=UPI0026E37EA9|nr:hypothetical protein [Gilvimarinus sp. 1_MG-2023]MDO6746482.1 hypothetical protein [Gilvimarinus sp. 1_MG-2023]